MLVVAWLSLHRWDLLGPIRFVGVDNWTSVLTDPSFATSLLVTVLFILIVVPAQSVLGLSAAAMLAPGLPGSGFFRTLFVLPWICAPLAIAVLWRWLLAPTDGAVSTLLGHRVEWLTDPDLALPVVSAVTIWTNVGYVTLFFLAGILAIPDDIQRSQRDLVATQRREVEHVQLSKRNGRNRDRRERHAFGWSAGIRPCWRGIASTQRELHHDAYRLGRPGRYRRDSACPVRAVRR
jgi:multiple sugar transport system permease protein